MKIGGISKLFLEKDDQYVKNELSMLSLNNIFLYFFMVIPSDEWVRSIRETLYICIPTISRYARSKAMSLPVSL